jgi:hypothetical protein
VHRRDGVVARCGPVSLSCLAYSTFDRGARLFGWRVGACVTVLVVGAVAGGPQGAGVPGRERGCRNAGGRCDVELAVGVQLGGPAAAVVEFVVVGGAEEGEVVDCGGAAGEGVDVVGFASVGGAVAVPAAAAVA